MRLSPFPRFRGWAAAAALAAALTPAATAKESSLARLLPPDTLLLAGIEDVDAYRAAQQDMPLYRILAEDEVQAFLEKPKAKLAEAIEALEGTIRQQPGFEDFDLSIPQLLEGRYGRLFLAVTHVTLPDPQAGLPFPDIGLVIGVEAREGAPDWSTLVKDLATRALSRQGMQASFQHVDSEEGGYDELPLGPVSLLVARTGDFHLFSTSRQALSAVLRRASGQGGESLATSPGFQNALRRVGIVGPGAMVGYVDGGLTMRTVTEAVKMALAMEGENEAIPIVDKVADVSGLLGLGALLGASVSENGVAHGRGFMGLRGEPKGLLACTPNEGLDLSMLQKIPKDVTSASLFLADMGAIYDTVMEIVRAVDEQVYQQVRNTIDAFGQQLGGPDAPLDVRNDVLANLGPQFAIVAPTASNPMMPSLIVMAKSKDPGRLMASLRKLLEFGGAMSQGQLQVSTSSYRDHELLVVSGSPQTGLPFQPAMAVVDGDFVLSLSVGDLKRLIRDREREGSSLLANEDFQRFYSRIPEGATLNALSYNDVKRTVESAYSSLTMALPMITMASEVELPVDLALLPRSEAITSHLFGSLSYTMAVEDGWVTESFGPMGGEVLGAAVGAAVGAGALFLMRADSSEEVRVTAVAPPPKPVEETPQEQARAQLNEFRIALTLFKLENDDYPDRLEQLLEPSQSYPEGYLGRDKLPLDPWGHPYRYVKTDSGYVVWSIGPNGQDENGGGDDLAVRKP